MARENTKDMKKIGNHVKFALDQTVVINDVNAFWVSLTFPTLIMLIGNNCNRPALRV